MVAGSEMKPSEMMTRELIPENWSASTRSRLGSTVR